MSFVTSIFVLKYYLSLTFHCPIQIKERFKAAKYLMWKQKSPTTLLVCLCLAAIRNGLLRAPSVSYGTFLFLNSKPCDAFYFEISDGHFQMFDCMRAQDTSAWFFFFFYSRLNQLRHLLYRCEMN